MFVVADNTEKTEIKKLETSGDSTKAVKSYIKKISGEYSLHEQQDIRLYFLPDNEALLKVRFKKIEESTITKVPSFPSNYYQSIIAKWEINSQLDSFSNLEVNWDGEGAPLINQNCIQWSKSIVNTIIDNGMVIDFCVPLRNGGIQLELDGENFDIEIEVHSNNYHYLIVYDKDGEIINKKRFTFGTIEILKNLLEA